MTDCRINVRDGVLLDMESKEAEVGRSRLWITSLRDNGRVREINDTRS